MYEALQPDEHWPKRNTALAATRAGLRRQPQASPSSKSLNHSIYGDDKLTGFKTRFLRLEQDQDGGITASLHVRNLDDQNLSWIALSYTWDSCLQDNDAEIHTITLNGQSFIVRGNLARVLSALLHQQNSKSSALVFRDGVLSESNEGPRFTEHTYFWIDALCINQDDISERNHQVGLMKRIYSQAALVVGWLTPGPEWRYAKSSGDDVRGLARHILHNPYWKRMWIIQEVILPPNILFLAENIWIELQEIEHQMRAHKVSIFSPVYTIVDNRRFFHFWGPRHNPFEWIVSFKNHACRDEKDKVYAVLGLVDDSYPLQPDYASTAIEFFVEIINAELHRGVDRSDAPDAPYIHGFHAIAHIVTGWSDMNHPLLKGFVSFIESSAHRESLCPATINLVSWVDWMIDTTDGKQHLRNYAQWLSPKRGSLETPGVLGMMPADMADAICETWAQLERFRQLQGISKQQLCDILEGTVAECYFNPMNPGHEIALNMVRRHALHGSEGLHRRLSASARTA